MKRLIKKSEKIYLKDIIDSNQLESNGYNTDYENRESALTYINGEIYEDEVHSDAVQRYYDEQEIDKYVPGGFVDQSIQKDINLPCGFASLIIGEDSKTYIVIYPQTLYNLDLNTFKSALLKQYPNALICKDENDRYIEHDDDIYIETI
jgi:hypothetical protein